MELRLKTRQWWFFRGRRCHDAGVLIIVAVLTQVSSILDALDSVWSREDIQSAVMEHEALNVVIR